MKKWFDAERGLGQYVDLADLRNEFEHLLETAIAGLQARKDIQGLSKLESQKLQVFAKRLEKMRSSASSRRYWASRLQFQCGAKLLKPQRLVSLTILEERRRVECTWQAFDFRVYRSCFGDQSFLEQSDGPQEL